MSELHAGAGPAETTPAAAPAAPAAPAPAADRPTSIDDALEQSFAASLAQESAAPETETPPVPDGDAPTTAEPPAEETPQDETKKGPIPFDVHKQALENARLKAAEEAKQQLLQEYQQQVQPVLTVAQAIARDVQSGTIDGLNQLMEEYAAHPTLGPQLKSWFGRMLSQQRTQGPAMPSAQDDPRPEADLQTSTGELVYSAKQQQALDDWRDRQWQRKLQETIHPLEQTRKQQEQARAVYALQQQALQTATQTLAEFRADPDFVAHEAEVRARMEANPKLSLDRAWHAVYREVVEPKKVAQQQQQWVQQAVKKSTGSTNDPAASAPAQWRPQRGMSIDEVLDRSFSGA